MAWENFRQKIVHLQSDMAPFSIDFLDRDGFKKFADNLFSNLNMWSEICITGYFSETARNELEKIVKYGNKVRIICPEIQAPKARDQKNIQALIKLADAGAEIKINNRLHARFLVAHHPSEVEKSGLVVIGSFDFNSDCLGRERYDAGIKTKNPDLVQSTLQLFNQIWNEQESKNL